MRFSVRSFGCALFNLSLEKLRKTGEKAMSLIKCPKRGARIPDNAKFCQECGCDVLRGLEIKERQQRTTEMNAPIYKNSEIDNKDVPTPKLSTPIVLGIASILALIGLVFATQISLFSAIISIIMFIVVFGGCISSIKDYNLAKKNFEEYRVKTLKEQKEAEDRKAAYNAQREQERKEEAEKEAALRKKRAEYSEKGIVSCPRCGSISISTGSRGYSMVSGFIGSGKTTNRCAACGYKWYPK